MLTLFTTPVVYLAIDRIGARFSASRGRDRAAPARRRPAERTGCEHLRALHRPAGRHHAADDRDRACRRARLFELSGFAAAAGRFPHHHGDRPIAGASPDVVATSLAAPLERHLGQIADVTELTSTSQIGQARIVLQFGLDRDINGAAQDVQAAINAAQADLPTNLLSQPTYRKVNPADAPVIILSLTSKTLTRGQMYDAASNVLLQQLSQLSGVGQVIIGGAAQPAVRVELDPMELSHYGVGLEDIRSALSNTNANAPKGDIDIGAHRWQIYTNDQANHAADYQNLVVAYRNGDPLLLKNVADVEDFVQDIRNIGLADGKPAVVVIVFRQPGANIITTVDW